MNKRTYAASIVLAAALAPALALAQNITTVNGKPVPKSRVDTIVAQVQKQAAARGQQVPPNLEALVRDKVVLDEILTQEAERRGLAVSSDYKQQMDLARQSILIGMLSADVDKKSIISDADIQAEYERLKAQSSGSEYDVRHILVEKEDEAKSIIAQLKAGARFEDLAQKNSKDAGSAANGGDLGFAPPSAYVPEFSQAMVALKKGEFTAVPVKTQFGYHVMRLEDVRPANFPALADVKPQIVQRLQQQKATALRDELRAKAKTDYKFSN